MTTRVSRLRGSRLTTCARRQSARRDSGSDVGRGPSFAKSGRSVHSDKALIDYGIFVLFSQFAAVSPFPPPPLQLSVSAPPS